MRSIRGALITALSAIVLLLLISDAALCASRYDALLKSRTGRQKLTDLARIEESRALNLETLTPYAHDTNPLVRLRCAEVLGRIGDQVGIPLLAELSKDQNEDIAKAAIFSLGLVGGEDSIAPLKFALQKRRKNIKIRVLDALSATGEPEAAELIISYLSNFSTALRVAAAISLSRLDDSTAVSACATAIFDPDPQVLAGVAYTLGRCEDKSHEKHIIELLENEHPAVRMRTVEALGRMESKKAIDPLFAIAKGQDRMLTLKAAEALARIGDKRCARALEELLSSTDPYMLAIALGGLEKIDEDDSFESILPLLDSKSLMVRLAALMAAGVTGEDKSRERLLAVYRSGTPVERMTALEALGLAGDKQDLPLIVSALTGGPDPFVREGAAAALGTWHKEKDLYEENEEGKRPIDALFEAVGGDDWVVASIAAESIGKIAEKEAIDDLVRLYPKSPERVDSDRKLAVLAAIVAIGERKTVSEESVPSLLEFLNEASRDPDPRVGLAAVKASEQFKGSLKAQPSGLWPRGDLPWGDPALPMGERKIKIVTGRGDIEIALYGDDAPNMVQSIITLAKQGFYKNLTFHRVVPGFVIQGGCPRGDGWGDAGYFLRSQFNLHKYERGTVGMAHSGKDTPGSQFFITHTPQPHLNGRYTVIGKVTSGMEVVDTIERGDTFDIIVVK